MDRELKCTGEVVFNGQLYDNNRFMQIVGNIKRMLDGCNDLNSGSVVAIYLDRGVELVASICALFEMNITFMILNRQTPLNRIEYMLDKAKADVIVSLSKEEYMFVQKKVLCVDLLNDMKDDIYFKTFDYSDNEIAYINFTSGSTGKPKAVQVKRSGLINFIDSVPVLTSINFETIIGCFTNSTFDIFILETIVALYSGARVVIGNEETCHNLKLLIKCILDNGINTLQFTPSRLRMIYMVDSKFESLKNIKTLLIGGESFPEELLQDLQKETNAKIFNMYGPTETTIWSTVSELTTKKKVDIGEPIKDTCVYVVNIESLKSENIKLIDKGSNEVGEICITGKGLALGYIDELELTNKAFVWKKINNRSTRLYRTGDLGKYGDNGEMICLGRLDNQIKLNGHRIELEEIEVNINKIDGISSCAVCYSHKYNKICSFIVRNTEKISISERDIKNRLLQIMPSYMCPSLYIFIDKLIYTSSGKIDRKTLIIEYIDNKKQDISINDDNMETEKKITNVFSEITGEKNIDSRTKIEGKIDSIQYIGFIVELEKIFEIEFEDEKLSMLEFETLGDVFKYIKEILDKD